MRDQQSHFVVQFTMTNLSPHLLQPLSIDTNITYDLDMSKFPGLDDPQHMYQPALLIATDWSDYVCRHDTQCITPDADINRVPNILDDLEYLQDSNQSFFSDLDPSSAMDSSTFKLMLDDVAEELSVSCDMKCTQNTRVNTDSSQTSHRHRDMYNCDLDCYLNTACGVSADEVTVMTSMGRGQKRLRGTDVDDADTRKKSKLADDSSVLPFLVSVCSTYGHCDLSRLS